MPPYENSMPDHTFIEDQLAKQMRKRTRLAVPETLHLTHALTKISRSFVAGVSGKARSRDPTWTRQLLQKEEGSRLAIMTRIEFQDGTRKSATQDYHGSGRPHVHFIVCAEDPKALQLDTVASASMPDAEREPELFGYVEASQLDNQRRTPLPVNEGPSRWNDVSESTLLHHSQADKDAGVRAYFPELMDATKCHQDVQEATDDGALAAYLVKYPVKFSDSMSEDWLNDAHGGDSLAQAVLFRYRPFEPEMALQLFGACFRQWRCNTVGGGKRDFQGLRFRV
jgi:hypothetical protein